MSEEKPKRTIQDINNEFAQVCAKLGQATYQKGRIDRDVALFQETLDSLNFEALKINEDAAKAATTEKATS